MPADGNKILFNSLQQLKLIMQWDKINIDSLLESSSEDEEDKPSTRNSGSSGSNARQGEEVQRIATSHGEAETSEVKKHPQQKSIES